MEPRQASRTARAAAAYRAAHQVLDSGRIFCDPLAVAILGEDPATLSQHAEADPSSRRMRYFLAVRTHFAEQALQRAVEHHGVRQVVILGAGLDTFAYRTPLRDRIRIFEVDHPATQAWKRQRLAQASIPIPGSLTFVPIDFERESLPDALPAGGWDPQQETFFTWMGVVPYLTREPVDATLEFLGRIPGGAQVAFDYSDPPETLSPEAREIHDQRAGRVAAIGEGWISHFTAREMGAKLTAFGFLHIEDLNPRDIAARYFPSRVSTASEHGGHLVLACSQ